MGRPAALAGPAARKGSARSTLTLGAEGS